MGFDLPLYKWVNATLQTPKKEFNVKIRRPSKFGRSGEQGFVSGIQVKLDGRILDFKEKLFYSETSYKDATFSHDPNKEAEESYQTLEGLKKLGCKTAPTFGLITSRQKNGEEAKTLLLSDLTGHGKYAVFSQNSIYNVEEVHEKFMNLKNCRELSEQMNKDCMLLSSHFFDTMWDGDLHMIAIDERENEGKAFITDVGALDRHGKYSHSPNVFYNGSDRDLREAGVSIKDIPEVRARLDSIVAERCHLIETAKNKALLKFSQEHDGVEIKKIIDNLSCKHKEEFGTAQLVTQYLIARAAGASQIGGCHDDLIKKNPKKYSRRHGSDCGFFGMQTAELFREYREKGHPVFESRKGDSLEDQIYNFIMKESKNSLGSSLRSIMHFRKLPYTLEDRLPSEIRDELRQFYTSLSETFRKPDYKILIRGFLDEQFLIRRNTESSAHSISLEEVKGIAEECIGNACPYGFEDYTYDGSDRGVQKGDYVLFFDACSMAPADSELYQYFYNNIAFSQGKDRILFTIGRGKLPGDRHLKSFLEMAEKYFKTDSPKN